MERAHQQLSAVEKLKHINYVVPVTLSPIDEQLNAFG